MPAWQASLISLCRSQTFSIPSSLIRLRAVRRARIRVCAGVYGVSNSFIFFWAAFRLK